MSSMKKAGWLILLLLIGCTQAPSSKRTLNVFAASSLTNAFTEIGTAFEQENPSVTVHFNFAGSQVLRTQIAEGALADVVAFASTPDMTELEKLGLVTPGASQKIFASNQMTIVLAPGNPAQVKDAQDLARPNLKLVIAAEQVPAGRYARQVLKNLNAVYGEDFDARALANVVSNEENVRQAVSKVQLGEADAAIVYTSDAAAAPELENLALPKKLNETARYPIAVLANSFEPGLAAAFIDYVMSAQGQSQLSRWGFLPPAQ